MILRCLFSVIILVVSGSVYAQESADSLAVVQTDVLRRTLDSLGSRDPAYLQETDLSVGNIPLSELLRSIATVNQVNLCVKVATDPLVACNFSRARITDLLYFLCREYGLEAEISGNIVTLRSAAVLLQSELEPTVRYDSLQVSLSFDFQEVLLPEVARCITRLTGQNVIVPQNLYASRVSSYLQQLKVPDAIRALAAANGLVVTEEKRGVWIFDSSGERESEGQERNKHFVRREVYATDRLSADSLGCLTAHITNGNLSDILSEACELLKLNYFFATPLKGQTSVYLQHIEYETFFDVVLAGSGISCGKYDGVYVFGTTGKENALVTTRVVPLRYRTAEHLPELIPDALKKEVQVQLFPDLNSLIVSGDSRHVTAVCRFLESIDRRVPLITIDVMIVEVTKSTIREAGIEAGLGEKPAVTKGSFSPGINMTLGAVSVNKLINSFNGFGSVNLGRVTPDFYMNLKFLEEAGDIELRSTPKLSTLNGHEATLKSGETRYYKEVSSNIIGSQTPIQSDSYTWKSIDANLCVRIVPYVGEDGHITLQVEIEQSEFTGKEEKDAPPSTATRSFKSQIRVKDGEMVLLGGIERNSRDRSSRGLPYIARIPLLKWLFGSTRNNKVNQKLNIFIKPTVL